MMRRRLSDSIFYFTRKGRRGSLFLLIIILMICLIPFVFPLLSSVAITETVELDTALTQLKTRQQTAYQQKKYNKSSNNYQPYDEPPTASYTSRSKGVLFYFDPNTVAAADMKKLGIRDKTIATIINYREKGGKFRQPEDLGKIWGFFPDETERLLPYIRIDNVSESYTASNTPYPEREIRAPKPVAEVAINTSDSLVWMALPGIGPKLSQRIMNFKEKLGGFHSVEQVGETFGLPDSVFRKIKPLLRLDGQVKKININTATLDELRTHPYIKYHVANAIVQYKVQHGDYQSTQDLKKIMIITPDLFNKMEPYLAVK